MMKLIGRYDSPFVRRVAISLHVQGFSFQHVPLSVFRNSDGFRLYNPELKAPTLVLGDGMVLTESSVILDYLDERTPERRLIPASGAARWEALQTITHGLVAAEKAVAIVYESILRPPEMHFAPMIERAREQVEAALKALEARGGFLTPGSVLTQVEITCAVAYRFVGYVAPDLLEEGRYPKLGALSAQCEELPAFLSAPLES